MPFPQLQYQILDVRQNEETICYGFHGLPIGAFYLYNLTSFISNLGYNNNDSDTDTGTILISHQLIQGTCSINVN